MKRYHILKMHFLTPLHIGEGRETYDFSSVDLHSDALTAALAAVKAQAGADGEEIAAFLESFRLSSAFPFVGTHYYLPRAAGRLKVAAHTEERMRKTLKKVNYLEQSLWVQWASGHPLQLQEEWVHGAYVDSSDNTAEEGFVMPYVNQVNQRVSVPRSAGEDARPFYFDWRFFHPQAGLYCLTDAEGAIWEELVTLMRRLGDAGMGTDKYVGGGQFTVDAEHTMELPEVADADATVLLSLYLPQEAEVPALRLAESRYGLVLRGGYMAGSSCAAFRHLWKKSVYMFTEGSVFPVTSPLQGQVADLKPDWNEPGMHSVFRSGKPFCMPVKMTEV